MGEILTEDGDGVLLAVKAVPGASRDQIGGPLGDRLKIRVAAAPEGGKANKAICGLLASALRIPRDRVRLVRGTTSPMKLWRLAGLTVDEAAEALGIKD